MWVGISKHHQSLHAAMHVHTTMNDERRSRELPELFDDSKCVHSQGETAFTSAARSETSTHTQARMRERAASKNSKRPLGEGIRSMAYCQDCIPSSDQRSDMSPLGGVLSLFYPGDLSGGGTQRNSKVRIWVRRRTGTRSCMAPAPLALKRAQRPIDGSVRS